jgi:hypothetical protein
MPLLRGRAGGRLPRLRRPLGYGQKSGRRPAASAVWQGVRARACFTPLSASASAHRPAHRGSSAGELVRLTARQPAPRPPKPPAPAAASPPRTGQLVLDRPRPRPLSRAASRAQQHPPWPAPTDAPRQPGSRATCTP